MPYSHPHIKTVNTLMVYCIQFQSDLRNKGEIRMFKLGAEADEFCVVLTEDYQAHVSKTIADLAINKSVVGEKKHFFFS